MHPNTVTTNKQSANTYFTRQNQNHAEPQAHRVQASARTLGPQCWCTCGQTYPFRLLIWEDAAFSTCCEVAVNHEGVPRAALVWINPAENLSYLGRCTLAPFSPCLPSGPAGPGDPYFKEIHDKD
uniref:Uncharacterized protein n=1 Tax=Acanthochromis polyacanthus TaxID=80966 RepID=A0A3Q1G3C5_9TELE